MTRNWAHHAAHVGAAALWALVLGACGAAPLPETEPELAGRLAVRIVTDEAEAALAILRTRVAGHGTADSLWEELFASEGYRRLGQRETAMGRPFDEDMFRALLEHDTMAAHVERLAGALREWQSVDLDAAARLALAYLPPAARIRASLYPVIKPRSNSFVFATGTDSAAIFMFLEPGLPASKLQNTLAHELHHIGFAAACGERQQPDRPGLREARRWTGAFGEGIAMLAAAGGPDVHPHAVSDSAERREWDENLKNAAADMAALESLFLDVLQERVTEPDSIAVRAMSFFGEQGPWYTVGWLMASTVEQEFGRERLVAGTCRPWSLLADYNAAAAAANARGAQLPLWSEAVIRGLADS